MRRRLVLLVAIAAALVLAACGSGAGEPDAGEAASAPVAASAASCGGRIAVMAPYGGLAEIDSVQMNWARVALDAFNAEHGTGFEILPANVEFQVDAGVREAQRLAADPSVLAVVGPQTSGVAEVIGPILDANGLAYVSPSATRTSLTDGSLRGFFRVVANDSRQGPAVAGFVADELQPSTVLVVTNPDPYSIGLADDVERVLRERGVPSERVEVPLEADDYAEAIAAIDERVNVVILPMLLAPEAKRFVEQMRDAGRDPKVVGTDSLFVSAFDVPGAYVSSFAPDLSNDEQGAELAAVYESIFGSFDAFGGPAYVAMEVVATAALQSCLEDGQPTREGVLAALPGVRLEDTILGTPIAFDAKHDVVDGRIRIYEVQSEGYRQLR